MRPYRFEQPVNTPARTPRRQPGEPACWLCRGVAVLAGLAGALNLAFPLERMGSGGGILDLLTVLFGFVLVLATVDLWWRRQRAGQLSVVLLAAAACSHLVQGRGITEGSLSILVAALLLAMAPLFRRRSRPLALPHAVQRVAFAGCVVVGWGVAGFWLMDPTQFGERFAWWQALDQTLRITSFSPVPRILPYTGYAGWFLLALCTLAVAGLVYGALVLVPLLRTEMDWTSDAGDVAGPGDPVRLFFSPSRGSFLKYRVQGQFAVVLGKPVGRPDETSLVMDLFARYCRRNCWGLGFQHDYASGWPAEMDTVREVQGMAPPVLEQGSRSVA